jgi:hypothetical protein
VRPIARVLARVGISAQVIGPGELAGLPITVADEVVIAGREVDLIVDRMPRYGWTSADTAPDDVPFVEAELRATLLDCLGHPAVVAVNGAQARTWFCADPWPFWRGAFQRAGYPVAPITIGKGDLGEAGPEDGWLTWSGVFAATPPASAAAIMGSVTVRARRRFVLWCSGELIPGGDDQALRGAATQVFTEHGVVLAGLYLDDDDQLVYATARPRVSTALVEDVANRIVHHLEESCDALVRR